MRESEDLRGLRSSVGELRYQSTPGIGGQGTPGSHWPLVRAFDGTAVEAAVSGSSMSDVLKTIATTSLHARVAEAQPAATVDSLRYLAGGTPSFDLRRRFERLPELQADAPCPLIVAVAGAKGGSGRTTLAANLAAGLTYGGHTVVALDMDPQNGLRHHFGLDPMDSDGLANATLAGLPWRDALRSPTTVRAVLSATPNLVVLPYGQVDHYDHDALDVSAESEPGWLDRHLDALALPQGSIVVVDLPAHAGSCMRRVLERAHLVLSVTLADMAGYMCQPQNERLVRSCCTPRSEFVGHFHVLNQLDGARRLTQDITRLFKSDWQDRLAGALHRDQCVPEALAHRMNMLDYNPQGQAVLDMLACVARVAGHLATCSTALPDVPRKQAA